MISSKKILNFEVNYRSGSSDEDVIDHSFDKDIFLPNLPEYEPGESDIVIDIGAHIGTFALSMARTTSKGTVYAFEPSEDTFSILEMNKRANNFENLVIYRKAVSDTVGQVKLFHDIENGNWGHSIAKAISEVSETVETETLEHFFESQGINCCDLIKFNCEGAEFGIILSTPINTLKKIRCMLILYHEDMVVGLKAINLKDYLEKAGFLVTDRCVTFDPPRGWIVAYRASALQRAKIQVRKFFIFGLTPFYNRFMYRMKTTIRHLFPKNN